VAKATKAFEFLICGKRENPSTSNSRRIRLDILVWIIMALNLVDKQK